MSLVECAVEKVRHLNESQAEALLEWLESHENRDALRRQLDEAITIGMDQLKRGEKFPGSEVHAEIRERSRRRRAA